MVKASYFDNLSVGLTGVWLKDGFCSSADKEEIREAESGIELPLLCFSVFVAEFLNVHIRMKCDRTAL